MTIAFADTFYYLALLNPKDRFHSQAQEFTADFRGQTLTTAWVLTELGDALSHESNRALFIEFVDHLRMNPSVTILPPDASLFDRGLE